MMKRIAVFAYGVVAYALFFGTFCYAAGFIGNLMVPVSMDSSPVGPFGESLLIDLALLGVFAVQHSLMARPFFKRWLTRFILQAAERSTYVLVSSLLMILMFWQWRPLGGVIWEITNPVGVAIAYGLFASGWFIILLASFLINHFDLFGLRQVWLFLRGKEYTQIRFALPGLYKRVRHPLYVGWFLAFWATPTMSLTHLVFALMTSAYILVAIQLEERDLIEMHPEYRIYRRQVPMLIPRIGRADISPAGDAEGAAA
jgi:protein-S-isoprenylcysteine O-methyltransferase Ste14